MFLHSFCCRNVYPLMKCHTVINSYFITFSDIYHYSFNRFDMITFEVTAFYVPFNKPYTLHHSKNPGHMYHHTNDRDFFIYY